LRFRAISWISCLFFLCFASGAACAQGNGASVTVRLYALHPQQHVKVLARTGSLRWRSCAKCVSTEVKQLDIHAAGDQLQAERAQAQQLFVDGEYRIEPQQGMKVSLSAPLELRAHDGFLTLLVTMPLEDYVATALEGESLNFTHSESLKAMAVAVRTYAAKFRPRHQEEGFDFCDNTHCQNLNFTGPTAAIRSAVEATRGELLWWKGSPAATYYHQNCGGTLAGGEEVWPTVHAPYLRQHLDPYCKQGSLLPWQAEFSRTEFETALRKQGLVVPAAWKKLEIVSRGSSGRALKLAFKSESQRAQLVSASSLRFATGRSFGWNRVRSDLYEVQTTEESIVFKGRGAGHGVGLCQAGAEEMAREGQSYRQILDFYYPGTKLGTTATGWDWQTRDSESFALKSTQPEQDAEVLTVAEKTLAALRSQLGWTLNFKAQLRVFPTLDAFRNTTGQPGWIAAYTRGHVISLQPLAVLKGKGVLESTVRHELVHLLVESHARAGTPIWFREGLALYLSDPEKKSEPIVMPEGEIEAVLQRHPAASREQLQRAYAAARTLVTDMVQRNGQNVVLQWLSGGLGNSARSSQH
jgi:stage II sporulation protein D